MKKYSFFLFFCIIFGWCNPKKHVLIIDACQKEKKAFSCDNISQQYEIIYHDIENNDSFCENEDLLAVVKNIKKKHTSDKIDGVFSSQDYIGNLCACLIAQEFNIPGPTLHSLLTCHHKYYSRQAQQRYVPHATPKYGLIDPEEIDKSIIELPMRLPFFVKPIKAYFSFGAQKISDKKELKEKIDSLLPTKEFLKPLEDMLKKFTDYRLSANYLLAEEILKGKQVTVEGFVCKGKIHIMGIVDSIMYPGTISFEHFQYPSALSPRVQNRMADIATTFIEGINFDNSFFNIEMIYNPKTKKIHIIEVNPRCASQFADFYEKVDGINSYEIMLALATNSELPKIYKRKGAYAVAASFALRMFQDGFVKKSPSKQDIEDIYKKFPDAHIQIRAEKGQKLSDELQDGKSYVYAIVNVGGKNKKDLTRRFEKVKNMLFFEIVPIC